MPQKVLKFTGINRNINEFQNVGACEELINLRPKVNGGLDVVKQFHDVYLGDFNIDGFYEHSFGNTNISILIDKQNGIFWRNEEISAEWIILTEEFKQKDVEISSAGHVLLLYNKEDNNQLVFKFVENKYDPFVFSASRIKIEPNLLSSSEDPITSAAKSETISQGSINEALANAVSGFQNKRANGLCGASVVGCSYELEDGSEVWSTAFVVLDSNRVTNVLEPKLEKRDGYYDVLVYGVEKASVDIILDSDCDKGVKKINIYASKTVSPFSVIERKDKNPSTGVITTTYEIERETLSDSGLFSKPMFYQDSISPTKGTHKVYLNFGTDQSAETLMDVNSGCIERTGHTVSLNNRFHYFNSNVMHILQYPTMPCLNNRAAGRCIAYVKINGKWELINHIYRFASDWTYNILYPMNDIEEVAFVLATPENQEMSVPYEKMFYVKLQNSTSYNYSYASDVVPELVSAEEFYQLMQSEGKIWGDEFTEKVFLRKENNAINVSGQLNPFAFPVKYSYSFGGEIIDIVTSYIPISSTQISQYPITVFTKNGIFAFEQGDGDTLYKGTLPLSSYVIDGKAKSTPHGVFFTSSKALYLLIGESAVNISESLDNDYDKTIRSSEAYNQLCYNPDKGLYDFLRYISYEDISEYLYDTTLTYVQQNEELIISSGRDDVWYSYVFNINTKMFHKIPYKYYGQHNASKYAIMESQNKKCLADLSNEWSNESNVPVFLQSRPFQLEILNTHIQRLILLVDTNLKNDIYFDGENTRNYLLFSVFGSDNLHDWKCIISSQKSNTILRHIRTNKAAKSYKDYVILINGLVSADTDLSDIIADYTVVSRRLG